MFFGATGDLAYKKIFPALQAMVKRGSSERAGHRRGQGRLEPGPAQGPRARTAWRNTAAWIRRRLSKLCGLLRYVDGDYNDPATFQALRQQLASAQRPAYYLAIPPGAFGTVVRATVQDGLHRATPA